MLASSWYGLCNIHEVCGRCKSQGRCFSSNASMPSFMLHCNSAPTLWPSNSVLASWQVVWSAWLSTLGHAPMVDPTDFFQSTGMDRAAEGVSQAISHAAATPFGAHAVAAVSGAAQVCSKTSDVISLNIWLAG